MFKKITYCPLSDSFTYGGVVYAFNFKTGVVFDLDIPWECMP